MMKRIYNYIRSCTYIAGIMAMLMAGGCTDNDPALELSFGLENDLPNIHVGSDGVATNAVKHGLSIDDALTITVRSNVAWKIEPVSDDTDWVIMLPMEGDKDGIVRIGVWPNESFDERVAEYAFIAHDQEQPVLFRITQDAETPVLIVNGSEQGINVPGIGGLISIPITTNLKDDWECTFDVDWLKIEDKTTNSLVLAADRNMNEFDRSTVISIKSRRFEELKVDIELRQPTMAVLLNEDFSWLNYGQTAWEQTTGEKAMHYWTEAQRSVGWTSIVSGTNTAWLASGYPYVYGRPGFLKLGATNRAGNVVSPPLKGIQLIGMQTADVDISFRALGYIGGGSASTKIPGPLDANDLYIGLWGDGEIGSLDGTNAEYTLTTIELGTKTIPVVHMQPNYPNSSNAKELGADFDSWSDDHAKHHLVIRNATANTRIVFFAGPFYNGLEGRGTEKVTYLGFSLTKNKNINRIFLDDVKAVIRSSD